MKHLDVFISTHVLDVIYPGVDSLGSRESRQGGSKVIPSPGWQERMILKTNMWVCLTQKHMYQIPIQEKWFLPFPLLKHWFYSLVVKPPFFDPTNTYFLTHRLKLKWSIPRRVDQLCLPSTTPSRGPWQSWSISAGEFSCRDLPLPFVRAALQQGDSLSLSKSCCMYITLHGFAQLLRPFSLLWGATLDTSRARVCEDMSGQKVDWR